MMKLSPSKSDINKGVPYKSAVLKHQKMVQNSSKTPNLAQNSAIFTDISANFGKISVIYTIFSAIYKNNSAKIGCNLHKIENNCITTKIRCVACDITAKIRGGACYFTKIRGGIVKIVGITGVFKNCKTKKITFTSGK